MSDVIDWSNAPDWADKHGFTGAFKSAVWFDDKKYTYDDGQQDGKEFFYTDACTYAAKDFSQVSERPATASWSGEGLPPVGTACEVKHDGRWYETTIIGVDPDDKSLVFKTHSDYETPYDGYTSAGQFRPIRTPEQIAEELADKEIKQIATIICRDGAFDIDDPEVSESAVALYDAGLRFTK